MSETGTENKYKLQLIDKIIISLLGIGTLVVTIITIIVVNNNQKQLHDQQLKLLNSIPYNETYKYTIKGQKLIFYEDINVIGEYNCTNDCNITKFSSSQFIIDNDDLIPIEDNKQVILYSVKNNKTENVLDEVPQTSINNKYGIIKISGKYGVINKHGKIVINCTNTDVDINTSHIVTLNGNNLYVYDDELKVLATKAISVSGNISISEKNNNLYITIIGDTAVTIIFDTKTNSFVN